MSLYRAIIEIVGTKTEIPDTHKLVVGGGINTAANNTGSNLTIDSSSGTVSFVANTLVAADKGISAAAGTGVFDFSASTGNFKTGSGQVYVPGLIATNLLFDTNTNHQVTVTAPAAGANGVALTLSGSAGGNAPSGGPPAGIGGSMVFQGGTGGQGLLAVPGATGGLTIYQGGTGGIGTTSAAAGAGGPVLIMGGTGGTALAGGGGNGGNATLDGGTGTNGTNGTVFVGNTNAQAVCIGHTGIDTVVTGGLQTGAFTVNTNNTTITIQSGVTLTTTGSGNINLPLGFKINNVAVSSNVTAANLSTLTAGPSSNADGLHTHSSLSGAMTAAVTTTGFATGELGYISSNGTVSKADATAIGTSVVFGVYQGNPGNVGISGIVQVKFLGSLTLVAGQRVWLAKTAGRATNDISSYTTGNVQAELGVISDTTGYDGGSNLLATILLRPQAVIEL
jgi:hypothetical protein